MHGATTSLDLVQTLGSMEGPAVLARALGESRRCVAHGWAGSSSVLLGASIARTCARPTLLVLAHSDDVDEAIDTLASLGVPTIALPAVQALPGEELLASELLARRLAAARRIRSLQAGDAPLIVCSIHALMQRIPDRAHEDDLVREVRAGERLEPAALLDWLDRAGYRRVETIEEPAQVALRGGIMDVFSPGSAAPVRLDFFGDEVESIHEIDMDTMGSDRRLDACEVLAAVDPLEVLREGESPASILPAQSIVLLEEPSEIVEQARGYYERVLEGQGVLAPPAVLAELEQCAGALCEITRLGAHGASSDARIDLGIRELDAIEEDIHEAIAQIGAWEGCVIVCCASEAERARLTQLCAQDASCARIEAIVAYLHRGFVVAGEDPAQTLHVVAYHELLHRYGVRRRTGRVAHGRTIDAFLDFEVGDYVVHAEHGIARYRGLELIRPRAPRGSSYAGQSEPEEYLVLEFAQGSRLKVPATRIDLVQRYVGGFRGTPSLSTLGGTRWRTQKQKVAESVRDLAAQMLRVRAAREAIPGFRFPADSDLQRSFEAEFPFDETEDQLAAIEAVKRDMQSERPMDRLICGDVGFGKTEVALRAAFKAVEASKQVAFLVPTTLLAVQHERTIRQRFADYPVRVESLTRFKTRREACDVLARLRRGEVDIVVGTHRLLSRDVRFKDLGLVVIDEEQRFGVEHKESLLRLRMTVDVLTMSATPIPRTLHMAMLGLRDISNLTTPPVDRRAIVTEVFPFNRRRIERAIARELSRGGQVYFVHNRVQSIRAVGEEVRRMAPGARVVVGHGQMGSGELEEVMLAFVERRADILVSTTIIESGIDIPTANTMIINDADRFGLAELHQLRGRVGRGRHRAYCYLLLPAERPIKEVAKQRLKAIEQFSMLGAGFKIAMRDLEIRGAGNLLGAEQSGHIAAVGYDMFCRLLDRAVSELRHEAPTLTQSATVLDIGISGSIPRAYIPSEKRRLEVYRRLAICDETGKLDELERDLRAAYGEPPRLAQRLLDLARIRVLAARLGVRSLTREGRDLVFGGGDSEAIRDALEGGSGTLRLVRDPQTGSAQVYLRLDERVFEGQTLLHVLRARLERACEAVA